MAEKDQFRALLLLRNCWDLLVLDLVLVEIGDAIDDDLWETASKVDEFVHNEAYDPVARISFCMNWY
jgi:hypothetical protein